MRDLRPETGFGGRIVDPRPAAGEIRMESLGVATRIVPPASYTAVTGPSGAPAMEPAEAARGRPRATARDRSAHGCRGASVESLQGRVPGNARSRAAQLAVGRPERGRLCPARQQTVRASAGHRVATDGAARSADRRPPRRHADRSGMLPTEPATCHSDGDHRACRGGDAFPRRGPGSHTVCVSAARAPFASMAIHCASSRSS